MKHLFTTTALLFSMTAFAQVGINNTSPKATLDITAKTGGTKPEGLIIPQLTGDQIRLATTATPTPVYGSNQKGLIVYASTADSAPAGATASITAPGYYYFDGSAWQKVITGSVANTDLVTGVGGIYKGSGSLSGNTTVTQGTNSLAFTSTATAGTSHFTVDGNTFNVDAVNNRLGIGTTAPQARVHISGTGASPDQIRMTANISDWGLVSEDVGGQNGMPGESSFNITDRVNGIRRMTVGTGGSFRLGGNISVGNAALSIDGPTNKVGIGINVPNATLDVKAASNGSTPEGIIAPRLSLGALQGYNYGGSQTGAIVYVNSASGTPAGQTANVTATGYYFFDGTNWQKMTGAAAGDTTNDAWINDTTNGLVKLGTNADGTARATGTDLVATDNGQIGIGTSNPTTKMHIKGDGVSSPLRLENTPIVTGPYSALGINDSTGNIGTYTASTSPILIVGYTSANSLDGSPGLNTSGATANWKLNTSSKSIIINTLGGIFGTDGARDYISVPSSGIYRVEANGTFYGTPTYTGAALNLSFSSAPSGSTTYTTIQRNRMGSVQTDAYQPFNVSAYLNLNANDKIGLAEVFAGSGGSNISLAQGLGITYAVIVNITKL